MGFPWHSECQILRMKISPQIPVKIDKLRLFFECQ
jgi:hypothetical protein